MAPELSDLVEPSQAVLVTNECQNGVIGEQAVFPALARAARDMLGPLTRLTHAARAAGLPVVHCVFHRRADGLGANDNARIFGAARASGVVLEPGSAAAALVDGIATDNDLVLSRLHGVGPMWGTDLEPVLRSLGARTVIVAGVSVNVGITNLVMDAVNAGFRVVLPGDAVAGVGEEYVRAVLDNTLSLLATQTTVADIAKVWER